MKNPFKIAFQAFFQPQQLEKSIVGKPSLRKRLVWGHLALALIWFTLWVAIVNRFYSFFTNEAVGFEEVDLAGPLFLVFAFYLPPVILGLAVGGFFKRDNVLCLIVGTYWSFVISLLAIPSVLLVFYGSQRSSMIYVGGAAEYEGVLAEETAVGLLILLGMSIICAIVVNLNGKTKGLKGTFYLTLLLSFLLALLFTTSGTKFGARMYLLADEGGRKHLLLISRGSRMSRAGVLLVAEKEDDRLAKLIRLEPGGEQVVGEFRLSPILKTSEESFQASVSMDEYVLGEVIPARWVYSISDEGLKVLARVNSYRDARTGQPAERGPLPPDEIKKLRRLEGRRFVGYDQFLAAVSAVSEEGRASIDALRPTSFRSSTVVFNGQKFDVLGSLEKQVEWTITDSGYSGEIAPGVLITHESNNREGVTEFGKKVVGSSESPRVLTIPQAIGRPFLVKEDDELLLLCASQVVQAINISDWSVAWDHSNHSLFKSRLNEGENYVPVYTGGNLYALSPSGHLFSIRASDGVITSTTPVFAGQLRSFSFNLFFLTLIYYTALMVLTLGFGLYRIPIYAAESLWQNVCAVLVRRRKMFAKIVRATPLFFDHISTLPLPASKRTLRRIAAADENRCAGLLVHLLGNTNQQRVAVSFFEEFFDKHPELLFQYLYLLLKPDNRHLLPILSRRLKKNAPLRELLSSYEQLLSEGPEAGSLARHRAALDAFVAGNYRYARELYVSYKVLSQFLRVGDLRDISDAGKAVANVVKADEGAEFNLQVMNVFNVIGELASDIQNYDVVENFRDKQYYLSEARIKLYGISRAAQEDIYEPERAIVLGIVDRWQGIITNETKTMRGPAQLEIALFNKTLPAVGEWQAVQVGIKNAGQSPAENIKVALLENENVQVLEGEKPIRLLGTGEATQIEYMIMPQGNADELRMFFNATFDDFQRKRKLKLFADIIKVSAAVEEFKSIPNPYVVGTPLQNDKVFFGRKAVLDFAVNNLSGSGQNNVLIFFGQRRVGKSSILYRLMDSPLKADHFFVYIDCQGFGDADTAKILFRICREIYASATRRGLGVKRPELSRFKEHTFLELDDYLDSVEADLGGKKIVLMFDEYEFLEYKVKAGGVSPELFNKLRNLMQHRNKKLAFIFVGTHRLTELTEDYWSFLFNIALYHEIGPLTEPAARALVTEPIKGFLRYDELALDKILRVTGLHPYFIQVTCRLIVNYCNEHHKSYITLTEVNEVLKEAVEGSTAHVKYLYNDFATKPEQQVLAFLARVTDETKLFASVAEIGGYAAENQFTVGRQELLETLSGLKNKKLVKGDDQQGGLFGFEYEFLRIWIDGHVKIHGGMINVG